MDTMLPDGTAPTTISRKAYTQIQHILENHCAVTHASGVMISQASGMLIAYSGNLDTTKMSLLCALVAGNYSTAKEIAVLIDEPNGFSMQYQQGENHSLYLEEITEDFFLLSLFPANAPFEIMSEVTETSIGQLKQVFGAC